MNRFDNSSELQKRKVRPKPRLKGNNWNANGPLQIARVDPGRKMTKQEVKDFFKASRERCRQTIAKMKYERRAPKDPAS